MRGSISMESSLSSILSLSQSLSLSSQTMQVVLVLVLVIVVIVVLLVIMVIVVMNSLVQSLDPLPEPGAIGSTISRFHHSVDLIP